MKIDFSPRVEKFVKDLQPKHTRQIFLKVLELAGNSSPQNSLKLQGTKEPRYRVDSGEYRIIYRVNDDRLEILIIGKRNDDAVYRDAERII